MAEIAITPLAGMNNVARDDNMTRGDEDGQVRFVRDALNVDIHADGAFSMRGNALRAGRLNVRDVWQSPLHGDVFCVHDGNLCRLDIGRMETSVLVENIGKGRVWYEVVNNLVYVAADKGIFVYDGSRAQRLTIDTPPPPLVSVSSGSFSDGLYGVAVSWLRDGKEGAVSEMVQLEVGKGGGLSVTLPLCFDETVTAARLYLTAHNGGALLHAGDYAVSGTVEIPMLPDGGKRADMRYLSPMPGGKFLKLWRGRLMTAKANILRFSEPLLFHLHDERFGYVQMPQRITFVEPVGGGIFVGQSDHVAFLRGADLAGMEMVRLTAKPPVAESSLQLKADEAGQLSSGGAVCVWLADNGFVGGTADGGLVEFHSGVLDKIRASGAAKSVLAGRRVYSLIRS